MYIANDSISNESAKCSMNIHGKFKRLTNKRGKPGDPAKTKRVYEQNTR